MGRVLLRVVVDHKEGFILPRASGLHLTADEVDQLVIWEDEPTDAGGRRDLAEHVTGCEQCQNLVRTHRTAQKTLLGLKSDGGSSKNADCPDESNWVKLATGLLEAQKATQYADHASTCDYCGQKLREAIQDLAPASAEEETFFAGLGISDSVWKDRMARKMEAAELQHAVSGKRIFTARRALAMAAAIVLAVGAGYAWWRMARNNRSAEELLAQAYSEHRTLELRFGNARHANLDMHRGQEGRALPLIEAEAIIARELNTHPQDVAWIEAQGRADLLAWNYEPAIRHLKEAHELQPDSPEVLTDLASAFFEQAEATNHPIDYRTALDYLGMALQRKPDSLDALFNHAVISERVKLFETAISDWNRYLLLDPSGEWSSEARARLADILKKNGNAR